ncbi:MAG: hypothetical protein IJL84_04985 [Paludibacteraceae bacterium]|nr:hypothetical protein [Paludibacteraceae bacterium]
MSKIYVSPKISVVYTFISPSPEKVKVLVDSSYLYVTSADADKSDIATVIAIKYLRMA